MLAQKLEAYLNSKLRIQGGLLDRSRIECLPKMNEALEKIVKGSFSTLRWKRAETLSCCLSHCHDLLHHSGFEK